jgi:hypothetical protein
MPLRKPRIEIEVRLQVKLSEKKMLPETGSP